jgi:hypothetical protein
LTRQDLNRDSNSTNPVIPIKQVQSPDWAFFMGSFCGFEPAAPESFKPKPPSIDMSIEAKAAN